jgi:hypothetical protein
MAGVRYCTFINSHINTCLGDNLGYGGRGKGNSNFNHHTQSQSNDTTDPAHGIRSPLLEEFRSNKNRKYELRVMAFSFAFSCSNNRCDIGYCWKYSRV